MPLSRKVQFTANAEADIRDLLQCTLDTWGRRPRDTHRDAIMTRIARLRELPSLGPPCDDLFDGCRALPVRHHVAYDVVTDDLVVVLRLLHRRQDPRGAVPDEVR